MPQPDEAKFLNQIFHGAPAVVDFLQVLFRTTQVIDDLIDRDKPVDNPAIFRAFWDCLFELPANPFYRQHEPYLRPIIASGFQDWWESARLERQGDHHAQTIAFVLRDSLTSVVVQCAYLVGGYEYMQAVAIDIRRHAHEETLDQYLSEFGDEP